MVDTIEHKQMQNATKHQIVHRLLSLNFVWVRVTDSLMSAFRVALFHLALHRIPQRRGAAS